MILREIKNMYTPVFQRIEYLESTGTQYIDTEVLMDSDTAFRGTTVEFEILEFTILNFTMAVIAGAVTQNYHNYNLLVYKDNFYDNGGFVFSQNEVLYTKTTATIAMNSGDIPNLNFILFGRNIIGLPIQCLGRIRIYSCKIIKNGDIIRDFIPVRVGSVGYLYDRVSKRLFGNKGTGNFVLGQDVNSGLQQIYQNKLIEGVDYETYDWLKADIPPIGTSMMKLPINSKNFEFKRNFIQLMNSGYFETSSSDRFSYYITDFGTRNDLKPRIWDSDSLSDAYISPNVLGLGLHTIIANDNGVTISSVTNTASLPWYGSPGSIVFNNADNANKNTIHLTSSIKVDDVVRYVPCQLLRSIPRNLDAQCKERQAGECGMIDLISGKFYGNVASSGTFTVENDNNE